MTKNMARYAFCLSLLFCGSVLLRGPACTLKADVTPVQQAQIVSQITIIKNFFNGSSTTMKKISLEEFLEALKPFCPLVFDKIIVQCATSNDIIAEEIITLLRSNEPLLPVDLQDFLRSKQNSELVNRIKEEQVRRELINLVSPQPRWKIAEWPLLVDKIVALFKETKNPAYLSLVATLESIRESGSTWIKFKLLKHLPILDPEVKAAGIAGLNRGLAAAGK